MGLKLIIAGSRTVDPTDEAIDAAVLLLPIWGESPRDLTAEERDLRLAEIPAKISYVVCGESPGGGADPAGKRWATARGIAVVSEPITGEDVRYWGKYLAPKMRNRRMAEIGDLALVFWDGKSNGSTDLVTRMVLRRKHVEVVPTKPRKSRSRPQQQAHLDGMGGSAQRACGA